MFIFFAEVAFTELEFGKQIYHVIEISRSSLILSTINQYLTVLCSLDLEKFKYISQFPFIFFGEVVHVHTDMKFCIQITYNNIGQVRFLIRSIIFVRAMPF